MQITITNDGSVPAEYELGVNPKLLLQPGESIAVDLSPQSPVIVRVPENLAELEDHARKIAEAKALLAEEEARLAAEAEEKAKAEEEARLAAEAKEQVKAEKASKKSEKTANQASEDTKSSENDPQNQGLFDDLSSDGQGANETNPENTK